MRFDKFLDNIRVDAENGASMLKKCVVFAVIMIAADVCVDVFVPFDNIWMNIVKTVLAIVTAFPVFVAGYEIACRQHEANVLKVEEENDRIHEERGQDDGYYDEDDEDYKDYVSYRLRYSPSQRLRQSLVFGAGLVLIAIVTSYTPVYTVGAAVVVAGVAAIVSYCRLTADEQILKEQNLPDPRDVMDAADEMDRRITKEAEEELRKEEVNRRKRAIRRRNQGLDPDDDYDEDDDYDYDGDDEDLYDEDDMSPRERKRAKRSATFNTLFG